MKAFLSLFLVVPFYLNAQVQIYLDLSKDKSQSNTIQTLSKPIGKNLFKTFERAFVSKSIKETGIDALVYEDSIVYKAPYESTEKRRLYKKNVFFYDIVGISFDVDFSIQNDKLIAKQRSIDPIFDVSHWREKDRKERQLFTLTPSEIFENREYSFLVKSYFNLDSLPIIRDHLCNIFNGSKTSVLLDQHFEEIDLASIKESMTASDTSVVIHCFGPENGEEVVIETNEYFFDDLEVFLISELNYCSERNAFEIKVLYYGMTLPMIDPETTIIKYRRLKFMIPNESL